MGDLRITSVKSPPDELFPFLESIIFGHAGVRYRRLRLAHRWAQFYDPTIVCLWDKTELIGCYVLDPRRCLAKGKPVLGVYRGLLCVHPTYRRTEASTLLMRQARHELKQLGERTSEPAFSFGFVEANNIPSLSLLTRQGCEPFATLNARLIYRQWPKPTVPLTRVDNVSITELALPYASSLCDIADTRGKMRLSWEDEQGERIGANVAITALSMETLGSLNDWLVRWFVLPFPFAKRRFNPSEFVYASLSYVYIRPGCESDWASFVTALTHSQGVHYAQLLMDTQGAVWKQLAEHTRFSEESGEQLNVLVRPENERARLLLADRAPVHLYPVDL